MLSVKNRFNLTAAFLLAALLFTSAAQAMEIRHFDKMADADQDEYVAKATRSQMNLGSLVAAF